MDGNRRWAKKNGLQSVRGHKEGANVVREVVKFSLEKKIKHVSLYTFSIENFKRPEHEKSFLFNLLINEAENGLQEFVGNGVKVRFIGDRSLFPEDVLSACQKIENETKNLDKLELHFLFCYGSRQEIVEGVKRIVKKVQDGEFSEDEISHKTVEDHLWTAGIPEPDFIIRTGGVKRLSNFLLYQAAYSDFYFFDCMWPEMTSKHLEKAWESFTGTKKRFGV